MIAQPALILIPFGTLPALKAACYPSYVVVRGQPAAVAAFAQAWADFLWPNVSVSEIVAIGRGLSWPIAGSQTFSMAVSDTPAAHLAVSELLAEHGAEVTYDMVRGRVRAEA